MKQEQTHVSEQQPKRQPPIAIIGIGCIFPNSHNLQEFWTTLREGDDAITDVPPEYWNPDDYYDADPKARDKVYAKRGAFLPEIDFNPLEFGIVPNALEATDTSQLLSLVAAQEALQDAGYTEDRDFDRDRVSVIMGVTGTLEMVIPLGARLGHPIWRRALKDAGIDDSVSDDVIERIRASYVDWQEASFPGLLGNVIPGRIANRFNFGGTNCSVDAACASSLSALHLACLELADGKSDMVVTGGVDTFNHVFMYTCFSKTPALSPSGDAKPFSDAADGTALGEGIGVLVVKRLEDAQRDGDKIYAVIRGIGASSDGKGTAIYAPSPKGQVKAFQSAYERAAVSPDTIDLMEAHGTGTKVGDATEITSMTEVYSAYQQNGPWCALGSVKSQIGHAKSAAGIAGLIKTALALHHKTLPPTIKVEKPAEALSTGDTPFYVNTEKRPWLPKPDHPRRAALSAFGFGGSNFHCVLEEADAQKSTIDWSGSVQILPFSAATPDGLTSALGTLDVAAEWANIRSAAARLRQKFDAKQPHRLVLVVEKGVSNFAKMVRNAQKMLTAQKGKRAWSTPDGIYYGSGEASGPLGVIFPGQGSQYVGMLRELACQFPQFQDVLTTADAIFQDGGEGATARRLSDLIYPHPAFDDDTRQQNAAVLQSTQVAQPAIGAVSLGLLRILEAFGVQPEYVAGHSYGELVALCAAGVLDTDTFFVLSKRRGYLMGQRTGDTGSMLAVQGDETAVGDVMRAEQLDLVIANKNSPQQTVLSGATSEIERARDVFKGRGFRCKQLSVAAAFHSKFVSDASGAFRETLDTVTLQAPKLPVYANSTAQQYSDDIEQIREILAGQLANPVEFLGIIEDMYAQGVRTFVEVGPSAQIGGLVKAILEGREHDVFSVDASLGQRSGENDLARALAQFTTLGYPAQLRLWDDGAPILEEQPAKKRAMTVKLRGINYVKPRTPKPPVAPKTVQPPAAAAPTPQPQPPQLVQSPSQTAPPVAKTPASPQPSPSQAAPAAAPAVPAGQSDMAAMLRVTQENLRTLQQFQEQTAKLHRQFLEGQDAARQSFDRLLEHQQRLMQGAPFPTTAPTPQPAIQPIQSAAPAPPMIQPPAPQPAAAQERTAAHAPAEAAMPAPTAAASPQPVQEQATTDDAQAVATLLLDVVAEKTGYPADMLDLDMGLDADLGIDSIKRVEILSALQQRLPHLPDVGSEKIGQIQTLGQIVEALGSNGHGSHAAPSVADAPPAPTQQAAPDTSQVSSTLLNVVAEKTGYPADMLDLDMGLDADLGIDSIKRVEILSALQQRIPHLPEVKSDQMGSIHTLGQIVELLGAQAPLPSAAAASSAAAALSAPTSAAVIDVTALSDALLDVVADKTGYPADMLELDMGLDADLGIDSIKRVEILSALQQRIPHLPEVKSDQMGSIHTLGQIVELLGAQEAATSAAAAPSAPTSAAAIDVTALSDALLDVVADKTGYPADMLELDMGLDADLGIDSIKRVEILSALQQRIPHLPEVKSDQMGGIHTLRQIVEILGRGNGNGNGTSKSARMDISEPEKTQPEPLNRSIVTPVPLSRTGRTAITIAADAPVWITDDGTALPAAIESELQQKGFQTRRIAWAEIAQLSAPERLTGLLLLTPKEPLPDTFLRDAFQVMQLCGPALRTVAQHSKRRLEAGAPTAFLATVSTLDGQFGFGDLNATLDPRSGGLAGLTKTAAREWPEVHCAAFDIAADLDDAQQTARQVLAELFLAGPVEIGISRRGVTMLRLQESAASSPVSSLCLGRDDVVVITGGARGVTAECAVALAQAAQAALVLLGRSPAPVAEDAWVAELPDEKAIQQAVISRAAGTLKPTEVRQQVRAIMVNREIQRTLDRIQAAGSPVRYYAVDVRDGDAVQAVIADAQQTLGTVTGLIHGAGVLADKRIEEKTLEQFASVYETKVVGLHNLLAILQDNPLRAIALFSSTTARVGRIGQIDYAAANEVLNKLAQQQARLRPDCRVVSINWGPWAGGMVTPDLEKLFRAEGIGLISYQAGAELLLHELSNPGGPVEVIALNGELPVEWEPAAAEPAEAAPLPMVFERALIVDDHPFLKSHVINGQAVLPAAISMEWLAHGALHSNPGLRFHGFNDFQILKGVKLSPDSAYTVRVLAGKARKDGDLYAVPVEMQGFDAAGHTMLHARAECLLSDRLPQEKPVITGLQTEQYPYQNGDIYRKYLFHGPDFHGIQEVEGCSTQGIVAKTKAAPPPAAWIKQPLRNHWLTDPLAVDSSFQMLILWSYQQYKAGSLPTAVGRYRQFQPKFPEQGGRVVAQVVRSSRNQAVANIEFLDHDGTLVARMENYECVIDPSLNAAFRQNHLTGEERP